MSPLASKTIETFDELGRFLDNLNYDLGQDAAVVVPRDGQLYFAFCTDPTARWYLETGWPEERIEEAVIGEGGEEYRPLSLEWIRALGPYTVLHKHDQLAGSTPQPAPLSETSALTEVLAKHQYRACDRSCTCDENWYDERPDRSQDMAEHFLHVEKELADAGFGFIAEAKAAAIEAAPVESVAI